MGRWGLIPLVTAVLMASGCGRAGNHGVGQGIRQIASIAAEGALMAEDVARGRSKATFVRTHGSELSAQALHEAEKLNDEQVQHRFMAPVKEAVKLAQDIGGAIEELRVAPMNRQQAREYQAKLEEWDKQAEQIVEEKL